jgi:hypothetical protein
MCVSSSYPPLEPGWCRRTDRLSKAMERLAYYRVFAGPLAIDACVLSGARGLFVVLPLGENCAKELGDECRREKAGLTMQINHRIHFY